MRPYDRGMPSATNPFREWLLSDRYQRQWVPVGQIGGHLDPAMLSALLSGGAAARQATLATTDWPVDVD